MGSVLSGLDWFDELEPVLYIYSVLFLLGALSRLSGASL